MIRPIGLLVAGALALPGWGYADGSSPAPPRSRVVDNTLFLEAGDRVVIKVAADGAPRFVSVEQNTDPPEAPANPDGAERLTALPVRPIRATPGTLAYTLWIDQNGARLRLENALDHPVVYVAAVLYKVKDGLTYRFTSICSVQAGKVGYESWSGPVARVVVTRIEPTPAGPTVCIAPEPPAKA